MKEGKEKKEKKKRKEKLKIKTQNDVNKRAKKDKHVTHTHIYKIHYCDSHLGGLRMIEGDARGVEGAALKRRRRQPLGVAAHLRLVFKKLG